MNRTDDLIIGNIAKYKDKYAYIDKIEDTSVKIRSEGSCITVSNLEIHEVDIFDFLEEQYGIKKVYNFEGYDFTLLYKPSIDYVFIKNKIYFHYKGIDVFQVKYLHQLQNMFQLVYETNIYNSSVIPMDILIRCFNPSV